MTKIEPARFLDKKSQPHTFTLVVLASISAMAMNIFLPSLPSMANHFNTSTATLGLTVGIYLAASAIIGIFVGGFIGQFFLDSKTVEGELGLVCWGLAGIIVSVSTFAVCGLV